MIGHLFGCKCRREMRWTWKEHISLPNGTDVYESQYLPNGGLHYICNKFGMFVYHLWLHLGVTFCIAERSIVQKASCWTKVAYLKKGWLFRGDTRTLYKSCIYVCVVRRILIIYNVRQSDVNLSMLALPRLRIPLMHGGVYYLPCGGWAFGFSVK